MQQVGPNYAYYPDQSQSAPSQHAFQASRDRIDYLRPGRDFHAAYPSERSHLDGRFYADSSRPAYASEAPSHASENFPARFSNTRSPDHDLSASIMAVGHRLREEIAVIGRDQKQLQDNILFEIDRIAARMSEQEAVLRDLHGELRRLLELHGVENVHQKQPMLLEPGFPSTAPVVPQKLRGQIDDAPPHFQQSQARHQPAAPAHNPSAREMDVYTQSWPSSQFVASNSSVTSYNFRRTQDEARM